MKKLNLCILLLILTTFILSGCQSSSATDPPDQAVDQFLQALQKQDYAGSNAYYAENLDNMANFHNQIEDISPQVANELFSKMAAFTYTIDQVTIDSSDSSKAQVTVTLTAYDLGAPFEKALLDYIRSDLEMTFDGAKSEDIIKQAEKVIVKEIQGVSQTFNTQVTIYLTQKDGTWQLDKISDNPELLNALSGNIIFTIDKLSDLIDTTHS